MNGLLYGGIIITAIGVAGPYLLSQAPSSIQSNETLQPIGSFLIANGFLVALGGLLLILIAIFL